MTEQNNVVDVTPNYDNLRKTFERDVFNVYLPPLKHTTEVGIDDVYGLLHAISMVLLSSTNVNHLTEFRDKFSDAVSEIHEAMRKRRIREEYGDEDEDDGD